MVLMPCKPAEQHRQLPLAGAAVGVTLQACSAADRTWALVSANVDDPARVPTALDELLAASARNLGAIVPPGQAFQPPGSTPQARSRRVRIEGALPDGRRAVLESAVFSHGTWVFQATVLGDVAGAEAAPPFFDSLRIQP